MLEPEVETRPSRDGDPARAESLADRLRAVLAVRMRVELVLYGSLQRSEYKSKLVEH